MAESTQTASETQATTKAGRKEWTGLAVIALPCLLYSMDLTVLNLALPALSRDLAPTASQLLWIVDIYGFLVAGLLMTMGTLGDRIGRRRLLLIGAAAFGVASVLAAFSTSAQMLIATRALLGVAGATIAPSTLSLIRNMFHDPQQRTVAIGVWIASYSVGAAIGPVFGGVLLEFFWWGSVFLVAVPVMVLLLIVGPWLLPEYRNPQAGRIDLLSAALSIGAVLSMVYGFKRIAESGLAWLPLLAIAAGALIGWLFLRRQKTLADPMIDLRLFRAPVFSAAIAVYGLSTVVAFGMFVFIAQHMQLVMDMSPLQAGLWTVPFALAFVIGSLLTPQLARRFDTARVMAAGLVLAAIGFAILTRVDQTTGPLLLTTAFGIYSLGLAPVFTLATDLIVGNAQPERAGAASAIAETCSEFGGALGIAILGSVGTALYRGALADAALVNSLVNSAPEANAGMLESARTTLSAALLAAQQLAEPAATTLRTAARDAFLLGFQFAAAVAAVVCVGTAALAWRWLKPASKPVVDSALSRSTCD